MIRKIIFLISSLILLLIILIFYLSFFGIKTNKFNENISSKIKESYPRINFEFKKINLLLNPLSFSIQLKTNDPEIKLKNKKIKIEEIATEYKITAFLKKDFGVKNIYLKTKKNETNDILQLIRVYEDSPQLYILQNLIRDGDVMITAKFNFDEKGKIKQNFEIFGNIENLSIKLLNKKELKNINTNFNYTNKNLKIENLKLQYLNLNFVSKKISILENNNRFKVNGDFENEDIKLPETILSLIFYDNLIDDVIVSSKNTFNLNISKKYKILDVNIKSNIGLKQASINYKNQNLKKIIPEFNNKIILRNHNINLDYNKDIKISGNGKFEINKKEDEIQYNFSNNKNISKYDLNFLINKIPLKIDLINYTKKENAKSNLKIKINKNKDNIFLENISYKSKNANFIIEQIHLNKKFFIKKFDRINMTFRDDRGLENDLNVIRKKKQYFISANNFSIDNIIKESLTDNNNEGIFDDSKKIFNLKIKKAFIDDEHDLLDLGGKIEILKNDIVKLDLESNFNNNKKVLLSVKTSNNTKVTIFSSELAKPFVKKFEFIKGFEEGQIDFTSTKNNDVSSSILKIYNFKLKELPALTKILTLASLTGISDLLTGEGVRFNEFEMSFTNKNDLMQIDEIYSIGPALSVLMEGYVQKDKLISLKGTLVPATTINKFVGSIPVLGEILVGKKTGEGVFGVSFKIKGPPKNLKTTVNPIKTLTPRFITRTLEKIKKVN